MSRVKNSARNIAFGYLSNFVTIFLGFISRTIFIYILGATYLGINGLLTNVLGILSFAELGIGTAMNYSLYKPVAECDREKIKSLMFLYKKIYRIIALIVTILGLLLLPYLGIIVTGAEGIDNLAIYYLIFLFNTATSYLLSYKFSLVNAEQKNYIFTNINLITNIITILLQMISLFVFRNFLIYLLVGSFVGIIQKIIVNLYLKKLYPFLNEKNIEKLDENDIRLLKKNVLALAWHKFGEVCVHQTDNIIISAFVGVTTVGILSNYNLIITSISGFITIIFSSIVSSIGNLIAVESKEKQYEIFKIYRFLAFWLYGYTSIVFLLLLSPFIELWLGEKMVLSKFTIFLIIVNFYMQGHRICVNNMKAAGGIFYQDKYVALIQAVVNISVSIYMVNLIGLPGVFIGTIAQGLIATIIKPVIIYRDMFNRNPISYFKDAGKFVSIIFVATIISAYSIKNIIAMPSFINLVLSGIFITVVTNIIFFIVFKNSNEFRYFIDLFKTRVNRRTAHDKTIS